MKNKTKCLSIFIFLSLFFSSLLAGNIALAGSNSSDITTSPRLAYPIDPEVTITGDSLEFKWWRGDVGVNGYDFMLYSGGGPSGETIVHEKLPFNATSFKVDAKSFTDGQTYTWSLRQQASDGVWGDPSFNTFKVNKDK